MNDSNKKPALIGRGEKPDTKKPEPTENTKLVERVKNLRELTIEERLAEHEQLLFAKAQEIKMLEEQHKQMVHEKNKPIYILTDFLFTNFCSDSALIKSWNEEGDNWNAQAHARWFEVGSEVYKFIKNNKDKMKL